MHNSAKRNEQNCRKLWQHMKLAACHEISIGIQSVCTGERKCVSLTRSTTPTKNVAEETSSECQRALEIWWSILISACFCIEWKICLRERQEAERAGDFLYAHHNACVHQLVCSAWPHSSHARSLSILGLLSRHAASRGSPSCTPGRATVAANRSGAVDAGCMSVTKHAQAGCASAESYSLRTEGQL